MIQSTPSPPFPLLSLAVVKCTMGYLAVPKPQKAHLMHTCGQKKIHFLEIWRETLPFKTPAVCSTRVGFNLMSDSLTLTLDQTSGFDLIWVVIFCIWTKFRG